MNYRLDIEFTKDGNEVADVNLSWGGEYALAVYVDGHPNPTFVIEHYERSGTVGLFLDHVADGETLANYNLNVAVDDDEEE